MRSHHPPKRLDLGSEPETALSKAALGETRAMNPAVEELSELAHRAGLHRLAILAWRDLDDAEAGGSELHAHEVATRWAKAGIDVVLRTSSVAGRAVLVERDGYRVVRRSGRYGVFATGPKDIVSGRLGPLDGLVEIWNGMPFLSPLWSRLPRVVFMHHVHGEMWSMTLPSPLAEAGRSLESVVAPPLYWRSRIVTLSESSRREIVALPGLRASRVSVVPPGIDPRYTPGGHRAARPLVVAIGRLVPVKNFPRLIAILARVHDKIPALETVIVGEGRERSGLEAMLHDLGAESYVSLPGRLSGNDLVELYRRAWVVASTSTREGWGLTVSEAAACATPAVATRIPGHVDAIDDGITGMLADSDEDFELKLEAVLGDPLLRRRLGRAASERVTPLTWEATARGTLAALVSDACHKAGRS
ncbi:MAG: glycosyltransferase family 4 protein [Acidimicrobiales bacterium]